MKRCGLSFVSWVARHQRKDELWFCFQKVFCDLTSVTSQGLQPQSSARHTLEKWSTENEQWYAVLSLSTFMTNTFFFLIVIAWETHWNHWWASLLLPAISYMRVKKYLTKQATNIMDHTWISLSRLKNNQKRGINKKGILDSFALSFLENFYKLEEEVMWLPAEAEKLLWF